MLDLLSPIPLPCWNKPCWNYIIQEALSVFAEGCVCAWTWNDCSCGLLWEASEGNTLRREQHFSILPWCYSLGSVCTDPAELCPHKPDTLSSHLHWGHPREHSSTNQLLQHCSWRAPKDLPKFWDSTPRKSPFCCKSPKGWHANLKRLRETTFLRHKRPVVWEI